MVLAVIDNNCKFGDDIHSLKKKSENPTTPRVITISYQSLVAKDQSLDEKLQQAFGPEGLGILTVSGVPDIVKLRERLLRLIQKLAGIPGLEKYEDAESRYVIGWSRGKETLEAGRPDKRKGSFYANPLMDTPTSVEQLIREIPHFCRPNIWPEELPELRPAFRELGQRIVEVGMLLATVCDEFVAERVPGFVRGRIVKSVCEDVATKGRLLHYYPAEEATNSGESDTWCGEHTDTGSLTGLTSAMYMRGEEEIVNTDAGSGLYVRDRQGQVVRVQIPPDHIAFQIGEAMQILSGGLLRATPHYVKAASGAGMEGVARNTFAVFMQPRWDEVLDPPPGFTERNVGVENWTPGITFGKLGHRTFEKTSAQNMD